MTLNDARDLETAWAELDRLIGLLDQVSAEVDPCHDTRTKAITMRMTLLKVRIETLAIQLQLQVWRKRPGPYRLVTTVAEDGALVRTRVSA